MPEFPAYSGGTVSIDTTAGDYIAIADSFVLGSTGLAADAGTAFQHATGLGPDGHLRRDWIEKDYGFLAWSWDPSLSNNGVAPSASGVIQVVKLHAPKAISVTYVYVCVQTAGTNLTANQCMAKLYDSSMNKIGSGVTAGTTGVTANQATAWASTKTKEMALTGGPFAVAAGDFYVAISAVWTSTTNLKFKALDSSGPNANAFDTGNVNGLSLVNSRYATADTITSTFPATLTTLAQTTANALWVAVA